MPSPLLPFRLIFGAILLATAHSSLALDPSPTPAALLQKMRGTYATLQSYRDETSVRFRNPDGAAGAQAECKIWFQRPRFFRIDGESRRAPDAPAKREVIWSNEKMARSWSTTNPVTLLDKIQLAGSKMFGTYAYHIPTLLEPGFGGPRRLDQLETPQLTGAETLEGVDCHRIRGTWQGDPYEIWLGQNDFLVHKIVADYKGYVMEEIHRQIATDENIPKEIFQFAPEKDAGAALKK